MKKIEPKETLFGIQLRGDTEAFLNNTNPWWKNKPLRLLPPYKRWLFTITLQRLKEGLAPVTVLRGPRQVGKTTLQEQIIEHLIKEEHIEPNRIFRIQFDEIPLLKKLSDPILTLCSWFENRILNSTFNESARKGKPVFLFFDEVQNLPDWAPQVKSLVDHHSVRVLLTGSSALRIEYGRDSLAGRIHTLEIGTLLLREVAALRGWGELPSLTQMSSVEHLREKALWKSLREHGIKNRKLRDKAFASYSERGGYPIAQARADVPWNELANQLNETIIRRVIQHDLRVGERGRKRDESLLEEIFKLSCRYVGQAPSPAIYINELKAALDANIGARRILNYLRFLNDTLLIRLVEPLEIRLKKKKGMPKICLCDHSLRASWLQEIVPLTVSELRGSPHMSSLAGHIAESIAGYFLGTIPNLNLAWFPERGAEPEVDFIITVGENRIPIEVKYQHRIDPHRDTLNLRAFIEKSVNNAPFGILVTLMDEVEVDDPRIVALPLSSLLLLR